MELRLFKVCFLLENFDLNLAEVSIKKIWKFFGKIFIIFRLRSLIISLKIFDLWWKVSRKKINYVVEYGKF